LIKAVEFLLSVARLCSIYSFAAISFPACSDADA